MAYNTSEISDLIKLLENESIPIIESIVRNLGDMLVKAELNRRNCLIAKTTGVSIGAIGTGAAVAGFLLAPVAGPLLLLPVVGLTLNGFGAATHIGTSITEKIQQKGNQGELDNLFEKFALAKQEWEELLDKNEDLKLYLHGLNPDYSDEEVDTRAITNNNGSLGSENKSNYVLQWLKTHIFSDEEIRIEDIKEGDHIYRPLRKKCKVYPVYHHGVYLGNDEIADFGSSGKKGEKDETPVIRPLSDFLEMDSSSQLYRRNYKGFQVPISRTITLAKKIVLDELLWNPYKLLENNCEHFATYLKLEKSWSEQASNFVVAGVKLLENASKIPKSVQAGVDVVKYMAKAVPGPPPSMFTRLRSAFGMAPKTTTLNTVSKAAIVIGPIMTAVDVAALIYDWKKTQPNIEAIQKAMEMMLRDLAYYKIYLGNLKDIRAGYPEGLYPEIIEFESE